MILHRLKRKTFLYISLSIKRSWHYDWMSIYIFVNGFEIYEFKVNHFEINAAPSRLGNVSKQLIT